MNNHSDTNADRWEELQITRLVFGLSAEEQSEYDELARKMSAEKFGLFDQIVASIDVAWCESRLEQEPLPHHLRQSIRLQAIEEFESRRESAPKVLAIHPRPARPPFTNQLPWLLAAACLVAALFAWMPKDTNSTNPIDLAQARANLIQSAKDLDLIQIDWAQGTTPIPNTSGDIVWSSQRQQGFMRFRGLPINIPTKQQYQLWIFDKNQSDKTPVDGGVFDITADGEVIVAIDPKLQVQEPLLFAITIEKPGGVVVSSRERLPLLAKVQ